MRAEQLQNVILFALLAVLAIGMGVAYWFGGRQSSAGASGPVEPVKKFRADPGTERENARALLSSVPSVKEETTDRPIEIWGNLDDEEATIRNRFNETHRSVAGMTPEEARNSLEARLDSADLSDTERAQLESALGLALLLGEDRDVSASREAFARAMAACEDADARVLLACIYGEALYERKEYGETLELLDEGRFVGSIFGPFRLKLEALRGLVLDVLGRYDQAQIAYENAFEASLASELSSSSQARDSARVIGIHLARHYREAGRVEDAVAVSRRLRAWLGEEDLVLR
jgi:hypothetical protein